MQNLEWIFASLDVYSTLHAPAPPIENMVEFCNLENVMTWAVDFGVFFVEVQPSGGDKGI